MSKTSSLVILVRNVDDKAIAKPKLLEGCDDCAFATGGMFRVDLQPMDDITKADCAVFFADIGLIPSSNDTWIAKSIKVTLDFNDGSSTSISAENVILGSARFKTLLRPILDGTARLENALANVIFQRIK